MLSEELQRQKSGDIFTGKKEMFIVDDNESVCRALKFYLMMYGFIVKIFSSAEAFLSTVPNSAPGCLILDVHMPGLDGWQTQQRLSESGSRHPVLFIGAAKDGVLTERASTSGGICKNRLMNRR